MAPKKIEIENKEKLKITWSDENTDMISLQYLRDECPCANCKGETILFKTIRPVKRTEKTPEMYKIKNIEIVGSYAIQITWQDGHDTGIYSWEYLRTLSKDDGSGKKHDYKPLI